jgi:hypothetical protein
MSRVVLVLRRYPAIPFNRGSLLTTPLHLCCSLSLHPDYNDFRKKLEQLLPLSDGLTDHTTGDRAVDAALGVLRTERREREREVEAKKQARPKKQVKYRPQIRTKSQLTTRPRNGLLIGTKPWTNHRTWWTRRSRFW